MITSNEVYQGQFGEFTITKSDRLEVIVYRLGLALSALSLGLATVLVLSNSAHLSLLTLLYFTFSVGLGVSLLTIHIYLGILHRLLQLFWLIGSISAIILIWLSQQPLALVVYQQPLTILGIGFTFAALTGIYFKEAFCFNRLETKFLTLLVPFLLLGHLTSILPLAAERVLLAIWAILMIILVTRKLIQPIPPDIGDKSVFIYLKQKKGEEILGIN
jgi:uncharacterized integral membrane protein